ERALDVITKRKGKSYDPGLADLVVAQGRRWWSDIEPLDPWDAALAAAPAEDRMDDDSLRESLLVLADFADVKSPWLGGHSRAVAALAREACGPQAEAPALLHDLGRVAVPNSIWDKPGPLTRDERERMETHALAGDQLLRRLAYTSGFADAASA